MMTSIGEVLRWISIWKNIPIGTHVDTSGFLEECDELLLEITELKTKHSNKADKLYMDLAIRVAEESYCVRKKVGTVIVDKHGVILIGYNGTASGSDNTCELEDGTTDPEVLHSEMNAFSKALRVGMSTVGATLYVTLLPCLECAKMVVQAGVSRVVYLEDYRCKKGQAYLNKCSVPLEKFEKVKRMTLEDDDYAYER